MADRPILTEQQITALEAIYKPRCFKPADETLEDHQAYRGQVELVALFRSDFENRAEARKMVKSEGSAEWEGEI